MFEERTIESAVFLGILLIGLAGLIVFSRVLAS
jgi:hypothetical protein